MHENAAGISITNPEKFVSDMNEILKDISTDITYDVDYISDASLVDPDIVIELAGLNDYIGTNFNRPLVYVSNISLDTLQLMKSNTLKLSAGKTSIIMFGADDEEVEKLSTTSGYINAVCKPVINEWNGNISAQLMIVDYEYAIPAKKPTILGWEF